MRYRIVSVPNIAEERYNVEWFKDWGIFKRWVKAEESYLGGGYDTFYRPLVFNGVSKAREYIERECRRAALIAANNKMRIIKEMSCDD